MKMLRQAKLELEGRSGAASGHPGFVTAPSIVDSGEDGVGRIKVAYLVNQYPKISHSFIRREIQALERQGLEVLRFAARGWNDQIVDAADLRERERTLYILRAGKLKLLGAVLRRIVRSPQTFVKAVALALKMARNAERPLPFHMVYLVEACWMVPVLRKAGVMHVHAHFGTNPAEVAMLVNALCGIPFSFTVHGIAELDRPEAIGLPEKIRRCAFAVGVSSFGKSQLMRWASHEHWEKIREIRCGLEPSFHQVPAVPMPRFKRLVCVARLSGEKGHLVLLEAASFLVREGAQFELVFAGDGEMRMEIEAAIALHGLEGIVRITGWLDGSQVRDEILASTAFVLPSFAEGLPVAIMEAMALRRPVISTYVAGIPELVIDGENGWLVAAGAANELAAAMRACLSMPEEKLVAMGESGRERVLARHDVDHEAARLAGLFRSHAATVPIPSARLRPVSAHIEISGRLER